MKQYFIAIMLLVLGGVYLFSGTASVNAYPSNVFLGNDTGGVYPNSVSTATTTNAVFMTPGTATTTLTFQTVDADQPQLFVDLRASSTATMLNWKYEYSNGISCGTSGANVDWYGEDQVPAYTLGQLFVEHSSSTIVHRLSGNTTSSTTLKTVTIPSNPAMCTRVVFSLPAGSANATVYAYPTIKRLPAN